MVRGCGLWARRLENRPQAQADRADLNSQLSQSRDCTTLRGEFVSSVHPRCVCVRNIRRERIFRISSEESDGFSPSERKLARHFPHLRGAWTFHLLPSSHLGVPRRLVFLGIIAHVPPFCFESFQPKNAFPASSSSSCNHFSSSLPSSDSPF